MTTMPRTITITPTWRSLVFQVIEVMTRGTTQKGKDLAKAEISRMARMADALPMVTDLLTEIKERNPKEAVAIDAVMQQITELIGE